MKKSDKQKNLLDLFHHGHHQVDLSRGKTKREHEWHHCGGQHEGLDYEIKHCACGQHQINKKIAIGHAIDEKLKTVIVKVEFTKKCPEGGWHVESGKIII